MNFLRAVPYVVTTCCDGYFAGTIWRCESEDGLHTHLQFDRVSNFRRWVRVLHDAWGQQAWALYVTAREAI